MLVRFHWGGSWRVRSILLAVVALVVLLSFPYGPLFPWSPVKPGYLHLALRRADLYYPGSYDLAYLKVDDIIAELEKTLAMPMRERVRIIALANWSDHERFCPWARGHAVAGVTLEMGTVVFITPRIRERNLETEEFLRHELTHAITHQNISLLQTQRFKKIQWLMEGVPVWFGKQKAYLTEEEFRRQAANTDLVRVIDPDVQGQRDMRFAYVAWRDFIEYLVQERGLDTFRGFYHEVIPNGGEHDRIFEKWYGAPLPEMVRRFQVTLR